MTSKRPLIHNDLLLFFKILIKFHMYQSTYLAVCSSGGVPATSVLGSEGALSTVTLADPGDPTGDVAAVWEQSSLIATSSTELVVLAP